MRCPYCDRKLAETAIRCGSCRRSVKGDTESFLAKSFRRIQGLFFGGRDPKACSWSFLEIILFVELIFLFVFRDPFDSSRHISDFLRLNFSIFT
ncbi:MAG: hypothetical protein ABH875_05465, partial [Candidatus Omnitrophota bacterium]